MLNTILMFVLAAIGLGFLIFIHELGHYLMARKVGMRVEVFSIGFGKPILSWMRDGVRWQVGVFPFGGYVKIAGMEKKGSIEPYEIPDGFFAKSPKDRIKVAVMGPFFNIFFAFVAFSAIWMGGGRQVSFAECTKKIGWVAKESGLYQANVRAGDDLKRINNQTYMGYKDFLFEALAKEGPITLNGEMIDYWNHQNTPFSYYFDPKSDLSGKLFFMPAAFLTYVKEPKFASSQWSSLSKSGITTADRLIAVDGQLIFSREQLIETLNEPRTLLSVQRGETKILCRVPRLKVSDIQMELVQKNEISDWGHSVSLNTRLEDLYFIPYALTNEAVVEGMLTYLNDMAEPGLHKSTIRNPYEQSLQMGDRIVAVDGVAIKTAADFLENLQIKKANLIAERLKMRPEISWENADEAFTKGLDTQKISSLMSMIGSDSSELDDYVLLAPITLVKMSEVPFSSDIKQKKETEYLAQKEQIEAIEDKDERALFLSQLESSRNRLVLGGLFDDLMVQYNPTPFFLFEEAVLLTVKTFTSLFSGQVSPKHLAGPVAIVTVIQHGISKSVNDGLFWLGMISLNLAIFNLMPIPVLDGGHILFSLYEQITKRKLRASTMEKLIIPFIILLGILFLYVTYNDILRVVRGFF